ncbi:uncharacterized protein LOC100908150 [Galendromus occidentalis]|uniref:Uncharacterized protein LOC100908150 n=1 Tax=Galendromus occidentalis TaxID=34638 RepID=A0AAJ6VV55_9ACAR|nr:uncharacterized protein LOC100908150 [Galendromus occidentalis]
MIRSIIFIALLAGISLAARFGLCPDSGARDALKIMGCSCDENRLRGNTFVCKAKLWDKETSLQFAKILADADITNFELHGELTWQDERNAFARLLRLKPTTPFSSLCNLSIRRVRLRDLIYSGPMPECSFPELRMDNVVMKDEEHPNHPKAEFRA